MRRTDLDERRAAKSWPYLAVLFFCVASLGPSSPILPVNGLMELTLAAAGITSMFALSRDQVGPIAISTMFISTKMVLAVLVMGTGFLDLLQAYKAFLYLPLLIAVAGRQIFSAQRLAELMPLISLLFFVQYAFLKWSGIDDRPQLLVESNFELVFLLLMFYVSWPHLGSRRRLVLLLIASTVLLSGSRSGIVELAVVLVGLFFHPRSAMAYLQLMGAGSLLLAIQAVFESRSPGGITATDRFTFFNVFRSETVDWHAATWLFGTFPLTPLTDRSCLRLSFYEKLFSYSEPGTCYSVIMHSYALRAIFDQGLIGVGLLMGLLLYAARRAGLSRRETLVVAGVLLANSASVSSLNSPFAALAVMLIFGMQREPETLPKHLGNQPLAHVRDSQIKRAQ